ncbi:hypothetical protein OUZ56_026177 [Daphnia magna]|uniref:Uncharacterized protein n=1 Tax=Daphnia magna TaxID=35525 RepID=A0ABQ9ZKZ7_9CRUS|nr:hypothetical protein OUZ56_026177 [Daphnia magna]
MSTYTGARSRTYSKLSENTAHSESETPLLQQPIVNTDHAAPLVTPATSQCQRPTRSTVSYKSLTITDIAEEHLASLNKRKPSRWQHIKATVSNSPSFLAKTIDWIRRSPPPSDYSDTESESALTSRGNKTSPTKPLPLCIMAAPGAAAASYHSDTLPTVITLLLHQMTSQSEINTIMEELFHSNIHQLEPPLTHQEQTRTPSVEILHLALQELRSSLQKLQEKRSSRPLEKDSIKFQVELIIISPLLTKILPRPQAVLRYNLLKKLNFLLQSPKYHPRHLTPRSRQLIQDLIGPLFVHAEIIIKDLISTLS